MAEDIRDHHSYPRFNAFWKQGEVTAKLLVPPMQVVRATILDLGHADTDPDEPDRHSCRAAFEHSKGDLGGEVNSPAWPSSRR
ncbi:hypothetical protein [Cellulomonas denverensis]|uniref:hypothetical protein n=1 Tax=Cellulomonas denverensis TaxID=264297 RepID=UPI0035E52AAE